MPRQIIVYPHGAGVAFFSPQLPFPSDDDILIFTHMDLVSGQGADV